jgi:hypothetical protein
MVFSWIGVISAPMPSSFLLVIEEDCDYFTLKVWRTPLGLDGVMIPYDDDKPSKYFNCPKCWG